MARVFSNSCSCRWCLLRILYIEGRKLDGVRSFGIYCAGVKYEKKLQFFNTEINVESQIFSLVDCYPRRLVFAAPVVYVRTDQSEAGNLSLVSNVNTEQCMIM